MFISILRRVEAIIVKNLPATFGVVEKVETQFGEMPKTKLKGEGGSSTLHRRIADNFYNKFSRFKQVLKGSCFI